MLMQLAALGAGLVSMRFLPQLPPSEVLFGLGVVVLLMLALRRYVLAAFGFGLLWACLSTQAVLDDRLSADDDGRTFWLEGRVIGLPEHGAGVVRFELRDVRSRHAGVPARLRLAWYGGPELKAGERWRLAARLKQPSGLVNPHGFDYEAWLLARRIAATGTVKAGERVAPAGPAGWRDEVRHRLLAVRAHGREGAVAALVVGDDSGLSEADWRILRDTGTVHLLVISGQHVSMLAGWLFFLIWALARRGWWPARLPWLPAASLTALVGALAYGALAGFDVPVIRACLMVALVLLWRMWFRHLGVRLPILLAFDGVLLLDPLASLQAGFWLSFGAVVLLALAFAGRLGRWSAGVTLVRAQLAVTLGLLPLLLALALPVSISGPLANLIAVPWVGLASVPLALLGTLLLPVPGLGEGLLWLAGLSLDLLFDLLGWIATGQDAWMPAALPVWAWLLVAAGALLLVMPAGLPARALGLVMLLPLFFPPVTALDHGHAEVWMLDVGQGMAVLVRTQNHALLYDAGPRFGDFDLGERVVVPTLRGLGVTRLDGLLLSHADQDHAGGAIAVNRALRPRWVISGEPLRDLASEPCQRGEQWQWDGVEFALWRDASPRDGNQASCVLRVEAGGERLLLTGDIDAQVERRLLASRWPVEAEWLLLPHHGSRTSSSAILLDGVKAQHALVSRGRHNTFGHPHPDVLRRVQTRGMGVHDTAELGAVRLVLGTFQPAFGQRGARRFWRRN